MRILVTGGCGFIGSHLAERLLSLGHDVSILDDFNDFYDPKLKEANLRAIRRAGHVALYRADIRDRDGVTQAFSEFAPEAVVHLAGRAGVRPSVADPVLYEQVNVGGTVVLLEAAQAGRVRKFVFASSSSIYGITRQIPFREDDPHVAPISPYAATKLAAEQLCFTYSHLYGMSVTCLRLFTVYGPRQRPDLAIRKFIQAIDAGTEITIFGDGSMSRDYTYVSDTVDGITTALGHPAPFEVFNLGNASPVTLAEAVATIERVMEKRARIGYLPIPPGDAPITYADISKAGTVLGYSPKVRFEDGIAQMVDWLRSSG